VENSDFEQPAQDEGDRCNLCGDVLEDDGTCGTCNEHTR